MFQNCFQICVRKVVIKYKVIDRVYIKTKIQFNYFNHSLCTMNYKTVILDTVDKHIFGCLFLSLYFLNLNITY